MIKYEPAPAADFARVAKLVRAKVNCIPYNAVEGLQGKRPSEARHDALMDVLKRARTPRRSAARKATPSPRRAGSCGGSRWAESK